MTTPTTTDLELTESTNPDQNIFSPQNIALAISMVLTVLGFVFHKNLSDLAGPITAAATALIALGIAIEHAIKYQAFTSSQIALNDQRLTRYSLLNRPTDGTATLTQTRR